jgi:hypothetical protein
MGELVAVIVTGILTVYLLGFMIHLSIRDKSVHENRLHYLLETALHHAADGWRRRLLNCHVVRATHGPVIFEMPGFKFCGASGSIML